MKELTIEEKAKAYDELIKRLKDFQSKYRFETIEEHFPELKESEDERIRKELIAHCRNTRCVTEEGAERIAKWIAWLEKQGEVRTTGYWNVQEVEQKPADKIKPKFKAGDWIVFNGLVLFIKEVVIQGYYRTISKGGITNSYDWNIENAARLWTIKDAKDGDVLFVKPTENLGKQLIIFGGIDSNGRIKYYCRFLNNKFSINGGLMGYDHKYFLPATKEQRSALFKAMADAGYEWDAEKKELKKIETKFHKGDWVVVSTTNGDRVVQIASVEYFKDGHPRYITTEGRWFGNGTKARLLTDVEISTIAESKAIKSKSWSEEDEKMFKQIIALIETLEDYNKAPDGFGDAKFWLESLKDRYTWKPSEEQMKALKEACDSQWELDGLDPLYTLYQDLKKLKG